MTALLGSTPYSYSGTGACPAGQFATTLNRADAPTCASPTEANITGWPTCSSNQFLTSLDGGTPWCVEATATSVPLSGVNGWPTCGPDGVLSTPDGGMPFCTSHIGSATSASSVPLSGVTGMPSCSAGSFLTTPDGGVPFCSTPTPYSLPVAQAATLGGIEGDGVDTTCDSNGLMTGWSASTGAMTCSTNAPTASALASTPTECSVGQAARGIAANGNAVDCFTPTGTYTLPALTTSTLGGVQGCTGTGCASSPGLTCASGYVLYGFNASGLEQCANDIANATTASALVSTTQCAAGQGATGISTSGAAQGCTTYVQSEVDPTVNTLGKATLNCIAGQVPMQADGGGWVCGFPTGGGGAPPTYPICAPGEVITSDGGLLCTNTIANASVVPLSGVTGWPTCLIGSVLTDVDGGVPSCIDTITNATNALSAVSAGTVALSGVTGWPTCGTTSVLSTPDGGVPQCVPMAAGGSPGGSNTQVQFNDSSVFGGDADFTWDKTNNELGLNGDVLITSTGDPAAAPAATKNKIFAKTTANRVMVAAMQPGGEIYPFQPSFFSQVISMWMPQSGTTLGLFGHGGTTAGTLSTPALATTNFLTSIRRTRFTSSSTAGSFAGVRGVEAEVWRGNAAGMGGFYFASRFAMTTNLANARAFVGLYASTSAMTNVDPSSLLNIIGMSLDSADANWQVITNDGSGTATKTNLGASYVKSTTAMYELRMYAAPNAANIYWQVDIVGTTTTSSGTFLNTNLPTNTSFLTPYVWITNNATASAAQIEINKVYLESDL